MVVDVVVLVVVTVLTVVVVRAGFDAAPQAIMGKIRKKHNAERIKVFLIMASLPIMILGYFLRLYSSLK